ncbi:MAG TPA: helix-turn-helix domain-containing protein [Gaiellaceae bacterium]|jgi:excisionase family DNA binding protein
MTDRLLTAREVADRLGFSIDTVLRWTREGTLPGYRISGTKRGRLRYDPADLEALLDERATAASVREAPATRPDAAPRRLSSSSPAIPPRRLAVPTEEEPDDAPR